MISASYLDGTTSRAAEVRLDFLRDRMVISAAQGPVAWLYSKTKIEKEYEASSGQGILSNAEHPDARLILHDEAQYKFAVDYLPRKHAFLISFSAKSLFIIFLFCCAFMAAGYGLIQYEARVIAPRLPQDLQVKFADRMIRDIEREAGSCGKTRTSEDLNKIIAAIAAKNGLKFKTRAFIVRDKEVNAFALPGHTLIVNKGMIDAARNENELTGIIAHEMAHLHHHHPQESFLRSAGIGIFSMLTIGMTDLEALSKAAIGFKGLSYSRDKEREADRTAAEFLKKAGLGTDGLVILLSRIEEKKGGDADWAQYLSTHPQTKDRSEIFKTGATRPGKKILSEAEWARLKKSCR